MSEHHGVIDDGPIIAPSKQARSRRSFEKVLAAATEIMSERRSTDFSLAEVVSRAGVSIGVVYGRVKSKDDLRDEVVRRENARLIEDATHRFGEPIAADLPPARALRRLIAQFADHLHTNAGILAAMMRAGYSDPYASEVGNRGSDAVRSLVTARLLDLSYAFREPHQERAASAAYAVLFGTMASTLGVNDQPRRLSPADWIDLVDDLTTMVTGFLLGDGEGAA